MATGDGVYTKHLHFEEQKEKDGDDKCVVNDVDAKELVFVIAGSSF